MEQIDAEIESRKAAGLTSHDDAVLAVLNAVSITRDIQHGDATLSLAILDEPKALTVGWDSHFDGGEFAVGDDEESHS